MKQPDSSQSTVVDGIEFIDRQTYLYALYQRDEALAALATSHEVFAVESDKLAVQLLTSKEEVIKEFVERVHRRADKNILVDHGTDDTKVIAMKNVVEELGRILDRRCSCVPRPGFYGGFTLENGKSICSTCRRPLR